MGVSAVIIEDKTGLKKNSLFGTEVEQTQDLSKISVQKSELVKMFFVQKIYDHSQN